MVDFSTYQPPGVYVEESSPALVSVGGIAPSVVALVGPSVGYRTTTETVTLVDNDAVTLSQQGINTTEGFTVAGLGGVVYEATDVTLTVTAGEGGDINDTTDNVTTIARSSESEIPSGTTVYVTYRYTDATYHQPLRVSDLDEAIAAYGPALDLTTSEIISPLTLAAKFAFDNGAQTLVLVATANEGEAVSLMDLSAGYDMLNAIPDANIIVPLPVGIAGTEQSPGDAPEIGAGLMSFIDAQFLVGTLRVGIVGTETTVTVDPASLVDAYRSRRIMHAYPNRVLYYNGSANTTIEIGGYYLAAAYAGRIASQSVSIPLTKKRVRGLAGIPFSLLSQMTISKKNTWSNQGVAVTEINQQGVMVVRHGTSTDRTSTVTREFSLVRARDALINLIQQTLDNSGLIGSYIEGDTLTRINGVIEGILETAITNGFIVGYDNVKSRQTAGEPTVIEVKFRYRPAYPLNYIVVSFSINTETGETTNLDPTA